MRASRIAGNTIPISLALVVAALLSCKNLRAAESRIVATPPQGWRAISAAAARVEFLGVLTRIELRLADGTVLHAASLDLLPDGVASGAPVTLAYDPLRVTVFR